MAFPVGQMTGPLAGNITTLNAIPLANARGIEANLGYGPGRLSRGYSILLLKQLPQAHQFEFDGTTLRSGGKEGLPAQTSAADAARRRVHDQMKSDYGEETYAMMQAAALRNAGTLGPKRLVKIVPEIRHNDALSPAKQYPMGGGFLQWNLKKPGLSFLAAAFVSGDDVAETSEGSFSLNSGNFPDDYERRAAFQAYLQSA